MQSYYGVRISVVHGFIFKMSGIFKNNFNNLPEINGTPQPPFHPLPPWGSFVKYVTRRFVTCVTVLSKNRDKMRKTRYDKGGGEGVKCPKIPLRILRMISCADHATNKSKLKP